jgi:dTDP-glucose pyrophosphorylase
MYDARLFEFIKTLVPSNRGKLEIMDVKNRFGKLRELQHELLEVWRTDAGSAEPVSDRHADRENSRQPRRPVRRGACRI